MLLWLLLVCVTAGLADLPKIDRSRIDTAEIVKMARSNSGRAPRCTIDGYDSHEVIVQELAALAAAHPDRASYAVFGKSGRGKDLAAITIAPGGVLNASEPAVMITAGIHGDELVGVEALRRLAREALTTNEWPAVNLVLVPLLNPDGREHCRRTNSHYRDLNRCFPDRCAPQVVRCRADTAPEVHALMNFAAGLPITASVGLHGGALTVSLPWDDSCESHSRRTYAPHPEMNMHEALGAAYINSYNGAATGEAFDPTPVTNGADWYQLTGGLQGWALETLHVSAAITIEMSRTKAPAPASIDAYWAAHRPALIRLLKELSRTVTVRVVDEHEQPLSGSLALVDADDNDLTVQPFAGVITRTLPAGTSTLRVRAPNYVGARIDVDMRDERQTFDVQLRELH